MPSPVHRAGRGRAAGGPRRRPGVDTHQTQKGDGDREGGGVDGQGDADPVLSKAPGRRLRDEQPGEDRTDELRDLVEPLDEGVGARQLIDGGELRDDGRLRRVEEAVGDPVGSGQDEQHPGLHGGAEHERGERGHDRQPGDVGGDHDAARREAVCHRATDQHERRARDALEGEHGSQHDGAGSQLKDQPGNRDEVELVPEQRDALAGEEQPEVAYLEHAHHARSHPILAGFPYYLSPCDSSGVMHLPDMRDVRDLAKALSAHPLLAWATAFFAGVAVLGVVYFFAAVSAAEVLRPMYDPVQRTISELSVGRYGFLQISAFCALGVSLVALPVGLRTRLRVTLTSRLGLLLILVCGVSSFVAAAFPTDLRNAVATESGEIHQLSASVGYACLITAMLLLSWHFRRDKPWRSFHLTSSGLTLVGLAMLLTMAATGDSDIAGLLQRIMAATVLTWVALAGVHAGRLALAARPAPEAERPD